MSLGADISPCIAHCLNIIHVAGHLWDVTNVPMRCSMHIAGTKCAIGALHKKQNWFKLDNYTENRNLTFEKNYSQPDPKLTHTFMYTQIKQPTAGLEGGGGQGEENRRKLKNIYRVYIRSGWLPCLSHLSYLRPPDLPVKGGSLVICRNFVKRKANLKNWPSLAWFGKIWPKCQLTNLNNCIKN